MADGVDVARLHVLLTGQAIADPAWPCVAMWCDAHKALEPTDALDPALWFPWPITLEYGMRIPIPDYLSYAGMGLVLEAMTAKGCSFTLGRDSSGCSAIIHEGNWGQVLGDALEPTLPLAVCRAALAALGGEG